MKKNRNSEFPNVSVIIPFFNAGATIERCLKSVATQTLVPFEILIYDDGSKSEDSKALQNIANRYQNVTLLGATENLGAGWARTQLLNEAKGDYIAFIDSDDVWAPNKLETQIENMLRVNADLCVCGYSVYSQIGEVIGKRQPIRKITQFKMHLTDWIPTSMTVMKAGLKGGKEMPLIRRRQDYAFWLKLFRNNPGLNCITIDQILGGYYRTDGSLSSSWHQNLRANFHMFRGEMGYSIVRSVTCVFLNSVIRVFRS